MEQGKAALPRLYGVVNVRGDPGYNKDVDVACPGIVLANVCLFWALLDNLGM